RPAETTMFDRSRKSANFASARLPRTSRGLQAGVTAIEYALLAGLISVGAILAFQAVGTANDGVMRSIAAALGGSGAGADAGGGDSSGAGDAGDGGGGSNNGGSNNGKRE